MPQRRCTRKTFRSRPCGGTPGAPGKLAATLHDAAVFLKEQKKVDAVADEAAFGRALAVEELGRAAN
ncbi:hypothetical protein [Streptomyces sp. NBC_01244]|uniref:hypothetical protein n=1 Tax=Streptomyces sp. NBC_01244 TaxID=2903797 RepID=UPI002E101DFD|nr:hypothetical protein OG247_06390 [Streptomyces sp. NBC_01244]